MDHALAAFRTRLLAIIRDTPEQGTRYASLVLWGYDHGLSRADMVAILADHTNYTEEGCAIATRVV